MKFSERALEQVRQDRLLIDEVDIWLYEEMKPYLGNRILEVGCGVGNFVRHLSNSELYIGTDIAHSSVEQVKQTYQDHLNMEAFVLDVTDPNFKTLAKFQPDTIISINVFEHIEDHFLAMQHCHHALAPGGKLIIVVPAHQAIYGTMDSSIGHYRRYNKRTLAKVMEQAGFSVLTQKYINAAGALGWYINGRLFKKETPPSDQLKFFNKLVPTLKRIERAIPPPVGISVLTVSEK